MTAEERFELTRQNVLQRIQKRPKPYISHLWPVPATCHVEFADREWGARHGCDRDAYKRIQMHMSLRAW